MTGYITNSFPLLTELDGCVLVYKAGKTIGAINTEDLYKFLSVFPELRTGHIWFDTIERKFFGHFHRQTAAGKEHSYCAPAETFLNSRWGLPYIREHLNPVLSQHEMVHSTEVVYTRQDVMEKFKNSRILLVGGGPSAGTCDWTATPRDHLWTMNKFYENDIFWQHKPSLVTLATNVDLSGNNKKLHEFMAHSPETFVSFEIERGSIENDWKLMDDFCAQYPDRVGFYHTRYRSQPGVALRLLVFAALLGAKSIDYVGIDGFQKAATNHFFEGNKNLPNWFVKFGPRFEDRQMVVWKDYLRGIQEEKLTTITNLGKS